ncbi:MAG: molybdopterin-binding protein [Nitrospirae bacterium]|nr:molybdopterin-binding protein [Nitrospirota bacterium]
MKTVSVAEAIGHVLAHDITEIKPGVCKERAFRKGHVVRREDVERLRDLGKEHLFVLEIPPGHLHEDDAVHILADALHGPGVEPAGEPREGKINLKASWAGILRVDREALFRFNLLGDVMCATIAGDRYVPAGKVVAGTRAVPLTIPKSRVEEAVAVAREAGGIVAVHPMREARIGVVVTGNEVHSGRIKDAFAPLIREKAEALSCEVASVATAPDDADTIAHEIRRAIDGGADLLVTSGGMSVDPDDVTREGIRRAGAREIVHGAAILPGSVFAIAYFPGSNGTEIPLLGIPACGIYHKVTVFDVILPRVLAGERIGREQLAALGHGGLCEDCSPCIFPACPYGKG